MPRYARIVVPRVAHHVTQRGNKKQKVFFNNADREFFLEKLLKYSLKAELDIISYCLMDNHTHLIVVPKCHDSLAKTFKPLHMLYSQRLNKKSAITGRNWQGRCFSSPMDYNYTFNTIKYLCLNPVKAGMVFRSEDYEWLSARCHLNKEVSDILTANENWLKLAHFAVRDIQNNQSDFGKYSEIINQNMHRNLPMGSSRFIDKLEKKFNRALRFKKSGRPV